MGLGKTAQAIAACDLIAAKRILIICPAIARINWARELEKFSKQSRSLMIHQKLNEEALPQQSVVTSYDLAMRSAKNLSGNWDALILDEAHFLKSIDAKRSKAILGKDGFVRRAKRVWALSGTPAPNHIGEMWLMLYTFGATTKKYFDFVNTYCTMSKGQYEQITGTKEEKIPEIRKMLEPIMLRRKVDDVMKQLPPIKYEQCIIPESEAGIVDVEQEASFAKYVIGPTSRIHELHELIANEQKLVTDILKKVRSGVTNPDTFRALEALSRSVSTMRRYNGMQKIEPIAKLLYEELQNKAYDKVIIFAVHTAVIEALRHKLHKFKAVTLYGNTPVLKRQRHIDSFMTNPKTRVFIGNIQACGTAINLTSACQVVFAEQSWVPGENAQAAMRCHRIGQTRPVNVRAFSLENSIDERVCQVLVQKTAQLLAIFDEEPLQNAKLVDTFTPSNNDDAADEEEAERETMGEEDDIFS